MPKITHNLEDTIFSALKIKAFEAKQSISKLINDAL
jgi:hypothetical protein